MLADQGASARTRRRSRGAAAVVEVVAAGAARPAAPFPGPAAAQVVQIFCHKVPDPAGAPEERR